MSDIKSCIVTVAPYSKARKGKKRLSRKDAVRALIDGTDLRIFNCNGVPCDSYCSVRDMAVDCSIQLREGDDCIACFHLTAADKAVTSKPDHDIPAFMAGYPVELD
jgi:hypothetical protein